MVDLTKRGFTWHFLPLESKSVVNTRLLFNVTIILILMFFFGGGGYHFRSRSVNQWYFVEFPSLLVLVVLVLVF